MRPTVKDVAALADVSPKTVSNVLGNADVVAPETRERVERAIERLGYVPNLAARGLRSGRTGMIALVVPDVRSPFSAELVQDVVELAHERALGVQLEQSRTSVDRTREMMAAARRHHVDGVLLNPATGAQRDEALQIGAGAVPLVMLGEVEQEDVDQVWVDSVDAARRMTDLLIGLGHRRIAMLGVQPPSEGTVTGALRRQGYREALTAAGLAIDPALERVCPGWTPKGGYDAMTRLLAEQGRPDAVFCATDSIALGALSALWSAGVRVPDEVSVAGFDDIAEGAYAAPPLTTVRWDKRGYAAAAIERLVARIGGSGHPAERLRFPVEIVRRESVRER